MNQECKGGYGEHAEWDRQREQDGQDTYSAAPVDHETQRKVLVAIAQVWERFQKTIPHRLAVLEQASTALGAGLLSDAIRHQAQAEAHKIAGSAGLFGCLQGSQVAKRIETMLQPPRPLDQTHAERLSALILALRDELKHSPQLVGEAG
jgi:HPt (histidine-containing phosphotransfer) domain-containing protein